MNGLRDRKVRKLCESRLFLAEKSKKWNRASWKFLNMQSFPIKTRQHISTMHSPNNYWHVEKKIQKTIFGPHFSDSQKSKLLNLSSAIYNLTLMLVLQIGFLSFLSKFNIFWIHIPRIILLLHSNQHANHVTTCVLSKFIHFASTI